MLTLAIKGAMSAARAGSVTLSNRRAANVDGTGNLKSGLVATGTSVSISALSRTLVDSNAPKKLELVAGIGPPSVKPATCSCSGRRGSPSELFLNVFAFRNTANDKLMLSAEICLNQPLSPYPCST